MRLVVVPFVGFALAGCAGTLSQVDLTLESRIAQAEQATERRLQQVEGALDKKVSQVAEAASKLKSEAIAEAKDAAADLVAKASDRLEATGKEVIRSAADQLGSIVDKQREKIVEDTRKLIRDDVPVAIRESIIQSADKVAERMGIAKETVPGPDGKDLEVWAIWAGAAGGVWTGLKTLLRMRAKKSGLATSALAILGEAHPLPQKESPPPTPKAPDALPSSSCSCSHTHPPG